MLLKQIATACLMAMAMLLAAGDAALAQQPAKPQTPEEYAALIRQKLPPAWRCFHDPSRVVITFDGEVTLYDHGTSAPRGAAWEIFHKRSNYFFTLTFADRLSEEQYKRLIAERKSAVTDADDGRERKGGSAEMQRAWEKFYIPNYYNDRHSILLEATTFETGGFIRGSYSLEAPQSAMAGRKLIMQLLVDNMTPYEKAPK